MFKFASLKNKPVSFTLFNISTELFINSEYVSEFLYLTIN